MSYLPTPEMIVERCAEPPLELALKCKRCGRKQKQSFDWASVAAPDELGAGRAGWDGILLSRVVECRGCGAVDDYDLGGDSRLRLMGGVLRGLAGDEDGQGRVLVGAARLSDGTIVRRPSEALARLRQVAEEQPDRAEAFRRLGNGYRQFGLRAEAEAAWRRACELDPAELEAACSLFLELWNAGRRRADAVAFLRRAVQTVPKGALRAAKELPWHLASLLRDAAAGSGEPLVLMAAWSSGKVQGQPVVNVSSVDLAKVDDVDRLADFLARPDLLHLDLVSELPAEEPTLLQQLLDGGGAPREPWRAPPSVGRNAPCPCGSCSVPLASRQKRDPDSGRLIA